MRSAPKAIEMNTLKSILDLVNSPSKRQNEIGGIINATIDMYIEDLLDCDTFEQSLSFFEAILRNMPTQTIKEKFPNCTKLDSIESFLRILNHPYPQNRTVGSNYTIDRYSVLRSIQMNEDGEYNGLIFSEPCGSGNGFALEHQVLLSLTSRVSDAEKKLQISETKTTFSDDNSDFRITSYEQSPLYAAHFINKSENVNKCWG